MLLLLTPIASSYASGAYGRGSVFLRRWCLRWLWLRWFLATNRLGIRASTRLDLRAFRRLGECATSDGDVSSRDRFSNCARGTIRHSPIRCRDISSERCRLVLLSRDEQLLSLRGNLRSGVADRPDHAAAIKLSARTSARCASTDNTRTGCSRHRRHTRGGLLAWYRRTA
jgi:hypothetical protein